VATFPLIGNYGVPEMRMRDGMTEFFESEKVQITGLVISDYSFSYSHWNAVKSLSDWLKEHRVPGIAGVDTRKLTRIIREKGAMLGKIILAENIAFYDPNKDNLVDQVSSRETQTYGNGRHRILLVD
jgi:carbamoylphosphate synthase small subunit